MPFEKKNTVRRLTPLLCLVVLLLVACNGGSPSTGSTTPTAIIPTSPVASHQIFRFPVVGDLTTTDPAQGHDADSNTVISAVYTGLVSLDHTLQVVDQMAQSYQIASDGLTYAFTLKPNLKFSDGKPITATDIIYSINRTINPATHSDVAYILAPIKDFEPFQHKQITTLINDSLFAPDPLTVKIVLSRPSPFFLQALASSCSYVVEKSLLDTYGSSYFTDHMNAGGSSGPFMVKSYDHTTGLHLVPNPYYYGKKPLVQNYTIVFYPDQNSMLKAYQDGQLDYTPVLPIQIASHKSDPGFREVSQLSIGYVSFNYLAKPFDDIKIRQAFALAINKDVVVQPVLEGAFTSTNHIVPQGMQGYNPNLTGPDGIQSTAGNPTLAKQLLQQGMLEEGIPTLTALPPLDLTYFPRNQDIKNAVVAIIQMWKTNLGVDVAATAVTRSQLLSQENATVNQRGPLQIWLANWQSDYPDPRDWLSTFFQNGSNYNKSNYGQNNSADASQQQANQAAMSIADTITDNTDRMAEYNRIEQQVVNEVGWLPLWQEKILALVNPHIQGLVINAQDAISPDDWGSISVSP